MTDIIYDTTTGTILQPDSGTKLYLDLNNDQCQVIENGAPSSQTRSSDCPRTLTPPASNDGSSCARPPSMSRN